VTQLLELEVVHAYYGLAHVLQGVSLSVAAGEVVALLGRNGAGKTTTLRSIMGLVRVQGGEVLLDGAPVTGRPTHWIARQGVGYVPEDRRMFPGLSVEENLRLAALGARLGRDRETAAFRQTWEVFPALEEQAGREASKLSGGQQQMLALARALLGSPRLLLVDEPTQGLAPIVARAIMQTVVRIASGGVGVLLVEQNADVALELADRAYVLDEGLIRASGAAGEIRENQDVRNSYLAV